MKKNTAEGQDRMLTIDEAAYTLSKITDSIGMQGITMDVARATIEGQLKITNYRTSVHELLHITIIHLRYFVLNSAIKEHEELRLKVEEMLVKQRTYAYVLSKFEIYNLLGKEIEKKFEAIDPIIRSYIIMPVIQALAYSETEYKLYSFEKTRALMQEAALEYIERCEKHTTINDQNIKLYEPEFKETIKECGSLKSKYSTKEMKLCVCLNNLLTRAKNKFESWILLTTDEGKTTIEVGKSPKKTLGLTP